MKVLGAGVFLASELSGLAMPPAWRKATRNMIFAALSIERALLRAGQPALDENCGLVLGSLAGELDTTSDFLSAWHKSRLARPLLFQNSLHNATTGFATIHFKIMGPSFTVSGTKDTGAECLQLASSLISDGSCSLCLVTLVEAHLGMAQRLGLTLREGAATLLLGPGDDDLPLGHSVMRERPLIAIDDCDFFHFAERF